ncbi:unnamed protein product [Allacma fusca]|uniref:Uncharacterized protein n=1 Tax=Allacma fusca TaxID=39272 RepID=A0A8J2P9Y5_9HEXA|nr:unnamed protein product [Allacma fusca]
MEWVKMSSFDYGAYPDYDFGSFNNSTFDRRQGSSREEVELDLKALDLMTKIRECKTYLRARLKQIEQDNQHLLLSDDVENIHFWLALAQEVRADCVYGVDTLEIAYQDIINMARKYPMDEVLDQDHDLSDEDDLVSAADPRLKKSKTRNENVSHQGPASTDVPCTPEVSGLVPNPLRARSHPIDQELQSEGDQNSRCDWKSGFPEEPSRCSGENFGRQNVSPQEINSRIPMVGRGRGRSFRMPEPDVGNVYNGQFRNLNNGYPCPDALYSNFPHTQFRDSVSYPSPVVPRPEIPRDNFQLNNHLSLRPQEIFDYYDSSRDIPRFQYQRESSGVQSRNGTFAESSDYFQDASEPSSTRGHVPQAHFNPPPSRPLLNRNNHPRYISPGPTLETGMLRSSNLHCVNSFANPAVAYSRPVFNAPQPSHNPLPSMYIPQISASQRPRPKLTPEMFRQKAQNHFGQRASSSARPRFPRYFNNKNNQRPPPKNRYSDPADLRSNHNTATEDNPGKNSNNPTDQVIEGTDSRDVPESSDAVIADEVAVEGDKGPQTCDSSVELRKVADNRKARLSKSKHMEMLERVRLACVRKKAQQPSHTSSISLKDLKKSMTKPGFYKLGTKSKNTFEEAPEPAETNTTEFETPSSKEIGKPCSKEAEKPSSKEVDKQSSKEYTQELTLKEIATPCKPKTCKTNGKTPTPQKPEDSDSSSDSQKKITSRKNAVRRRATPVKEFGDVGKRPTAARKTPHKDQVKIKFPFQKKASPKGALKGRRVIESSSESDEVSEPAAPVKTPSSSSYSEEDDSSSEDDETIYLRTFLKQMNIPSDDIERLLSDQFHKADLLDTIKTSLAEAGRPARSPEKEVISPLQLENPGIVKVLKSLCMDSDGSEDAQGDSRQNRKRKQDEISSAPETVTAEVAQEPPLNVESSPVKKRGRPHGSGKSGHYSIPDSMFKNPKTQKIQPAVIPVHLGLTKIKIETDYVASSIKIEPQSHYED